MIGTLAIGSAIIAAAFSAASGARARRVWTPLNTEGTCRVCGCLRVEHIGDPDGSYACPHTADSLTTEQILEWHHAGGAAEFALDASAELRNNLRSIGLRWEARNDKFCESVRRHIADQFNRKESK
jgi:hypothetical protein